VNIIAIPRKARSIIYYVLGTLYVVLTVLASAHIVDPLYALLTTSVAGVYGVSLARGNLPPDGQADTL
jgi:uncharacterized membrane protein